MKKLWKVLSVVLCGAMLLTGCGKSVETTSDSNGITSNSQKPESEEGISSLQEPGFGKAGEKTLSSVFSTDNNAIWYYVGGPIAKDTYPTVYYIFHDGSLTVYNFMYQSDNRPYSLGELSRMTDDEIISALESWEKGNDKEKLVQAIAKCDESIALIEEWSIFSEEIEGWLADNGRDFTLSDLKVLLEQMKKNFEESIENGINKTYSMSGFALYTDSTGNNVVSESIAYERTEILSPDNCYLGNYGMYRE